MPRKSEKVSINDIARAVQVSAGTVSNALNDRKGVSPAKKQEILAIAKKMGYEKSTVQKETKEVRFIYFKRHGYVVDDTPFFSQLISGIETACRTNGYKMLITQIDLVENNTKEILKNLESDSCDGTIVLATEMVRGDLALFEGIKKPVVYLDNCFREGNCDCVLIANENSSYTATKLIIEYGHRRIGLLASSTHINNFYYRRRGFHTAVEEFGLTVDPKHEFYLCPTNEGSYRDMKKLLEDYQSKMPTAFFAENDIIAQGAIRAMKEAGINIPEDVSVIGFDDMPFCELVTPRLTTVGVNKQKIGEESVMLLLKRIEQDKVSAIKIEVETKLMIRDSVIRIDPEYSISKNPLSEIL